MQKLALHKFRSYEILSYAETIGKSREIARKELKHLAEVGLLKEIPVGKKFIYKIEKSNLDKMIGASDVEDSDLSEPESLGR